MDIAFGQHLVSRWRRLQHLPNLPGELTTGPLNVRCRVQCSSDASIGVGYSHSANGIPGSQDAEDINEQVGKGSPLPVLPMT